MSASSSSRRPRKLSVEIEGFFNHSLSRSYPNLNEKCQFVHLEGKSFEEYGDDYMCSNVLSLCTQLKAENREILSQDIAKTIVKNLPKSEMIPRVSIRCGCYLTFKLSRKWMDKRVKNMLANGIDTWAPTYNLKKVVIRFPESGIGSDAHADGIRANCIQEMLNRTFSYCGVEVFPHDVFGEFAAKSYLRAYKEVGKHFLIEQGNFKKRSGRMEEPPLFVAPETEEPTSTSTEIAFKDLKDIWLAICVLKADLTLYLAPLRRQGYIERCFEAARDVRWINDRRRYYSVYRTSPNEKKKLTSLVRDFWNYSKLDSLLKLGLTAGMAGTGETVFELALKYAYLKTHRLDELPSSIEELFDEKENTFVYLLRTQALVHSVIKNPRRGTPKLMKALAAKEHELASHLVRFTEVLKEACSLVLPNILCEYLYDLSKKFTSLYGKVQPFESELLLCNATSVVMTKCFDLLGINPHCSGGYLFQELFVPPKGPKIVNPFIPWSNPDDSRLNPRIELFSMFIHIDDDIQVGNLYGLLSLKDDKTTGFVDFFSRELYEPMAICNSSYLYLSNPSAIYTLGFGSPIEIYVNLVVTSEKDGSRKDAYEVARGMDELEMSNFWEKKDIRSKCEVLAFKNSTSLLQIHYVLLKDAVDVTFEVTFESPDSKGLNVRGQIFAWYGGTVLDEIPDAQRRHYRACIFTTDGKWVYPGTKLQLDKNFLAVLAGGDLVLQAQLETISGEILVDDQVNYSLLTNEGLKRRVLVKKDRTKKDKTGSSRGSSKSSLVGSFHLTLKWTKCEASSFSA